MPSKYEIRTVILYCFKRGLSKTQVKKENAALKGTSWASFTIIDVQLSNWVANFLDTKSATRFY